MKLTFPRFLLEFTGNAYLHKYPCFFTYRPQHHKVTGKEVRQIISVLQPGDILLRRYDGYLNTIFTPGFWGHAAIAVTSDRVIHAVSQGVIEEDILEFSRCDSLAVLRPKVPQANAIHLAAKFALECWGYDYAFQRNNGKVYCTELVDACYEGLFCDEYTVEMGNNLLTPEHIYTSDHVYVVAEFRH